MQLTLYTDYGLRLLVYLAALPAGERANIDTVSETFNVSRNHINKVVHHMGRLGWINTRRGKGGGFSLDIDPTELNLADIVTALEPSMLAVDCYEPQCVLLPTCKLKGVLASAMNAFVEELRQYSLADVSNSPAELVRVLGLEEQAFVSPPN